MIACTGDMPKMVWIMSTTLDTTHHIAEPWGDDLDLNSCERKPIPTTILICAASDSSRLSRVRQQRACPTPGCDGSGHVNQKYKSHGSVSTCPRALENSNAVTMAISSNVLNQWAAHLYAIIHSCLPGDPSSASQRAPSQKGTLACVDQQGYSITHPFNKVFASHPMLPTRTYS